MIRKPFRYWYIYEDAFGSKFSYLQAIASDWRLSFRKLMLEKA
jgi:hypothetical protein